MRICSNCGATNETDGSPICRKCGALLPVASKKKRIRIPTSTKQEDKKSEPKVEPLEEKKALQEKIEKMQKALDNPNIQGEAKRAVQSSLKNAKAQLAEMEKEEPKPAPAKAKQAKQPATKKTTPKPKPAASAKPYLPKLRIRRFKKVEFEPSPKSKGLESIVRNFVSKDSLVQNLNVVNFDAKGITATDAQSLVIGK